MEGNPTGTIEQQVAYLLTQVSTLTQANQSLTTALASQTEKLQVLESSLQGEVGNLTTNQESLQTLIHSHSQSLTNESTARGVVDGGLTSEVIGIKDQHLNDHTYILGLVEEHHGEWMAASASQTNAMIDETQARLVGDETNKARIEVVRTELDSKVDALGAEVATYNDVLDFTTMDDIDLTMDSDYPLDWSLLSASQEWRLEIDEYIRNAKKALDTKLSAAEATIAEANVIAQQALANTDVGALLESLQGNIGIESLDAILWGKVSRIDGLTGEILAGTDSLKAELLSQIAVAKAKADQAATDILSEALERVDAMALEAQIRSDQIALSAMELQNGITVETQNRIDGDAEVVGQLTAYKTSNDTAVASALQIANSAVTTGSANSNSITSLQTAMNTANAAIATKAESSALSTLDTKVTGIDGRVTTNTSSITSLSGRVTTVEGSVATKAEASALTALTTRVTNAEGVNTSQGTSITNLNNSLTTTNTNVTTAQTAANNAMTAAGAKGKVLFQSTVPVAADQLSQNLWIDTTSNANTPKRWNGTAWASVTDKVATDAAAAAAAANTALTSKADASAVTSLTTRVTNVEGVNTSQASALTNLSTTVDGYATSISETTTTLNGIKAVKAVTVDNNGVLSGYGLISQLVNGQVTSGFGINADQFYVGAPASGKKPFVVLTSQQTINGKVYPPGTWIDAAYIANASIDSAKIGNLDADKITTGTFAAARIGANTITADKLSVSSLSAITADLGTLTTTAADGSKTVMTGGKTEVFYPNGNIAVRLGVW